MYKLCVTRDGNVLLGLRLVCVIKRHDTGHRNAADGFSPKA
ncbi:hypothetical protein HMPREF0860_2330 [Treponema socranskii subsp. socranskii VPI DR56BR1116 = ATCC 35536]|uniref:Uncharacterized protein n=1 Tax=Treponema socranskii subsp. socranskii VPI DR56BR1116 = ATCC 35536 TaxID=1125725 RepID=U1F9G2_TRESO|nr:hypothetical protein HMPREF1325_2096 [Treponema socranskii subsp. socranskii VPI DR56BR1116 = ATCC 35536]ERK04341.1 hypothetical protein HMPREF0860_2330 [Treponema socranskii subsp. socranskii VPI DR56BR1116 = ATCC 35536]